VQSRSPHGPEQRTGTWGWRRTSPAGLPQLQEATPAQLASRGDRYATVGINCPPAKGGMAPPSRQTVAFHSRRSAAIPPKLHHYVVYCRSCSVTVLHNLARITCPYLLQFLRSAHAGCQNPHSVPRRKGRSMPAR